MTRKHTFRALVLFAVFTGSIVSLGEKAFAHCDGMDGPVVKAAQKALETGNVNLILIWVQESDEPAITRAFHKTLAVRKLNAEAKELADMYFFETVVRVHRAGEGAPYTGLKPAGRDLGPAIPAGDKAIADGTAAPVLKLLTDAARTGLDKHFRQVLSKKEFEQNDVEAGRAYVEAYVVYIHYVERLYQAAAKPASGHYNEGDEVAVLRTHAAGRSHPAPSSTKELRP